MDGMTALYILVEFSLLVIVYGIGRYDGKWGERFELMQKIRKISLDGETVGTRYHVMVVKAALIESLRKGWK